MTKVKSNKQRKQAVAKAVSTAKAASATKKKRARTAKGRYVADDPSTPDVNEDWET